MNTFLEKYDAIVVFGNYRYGSTALCNILHNFFTSNGVNAFNWSEYLSMNQYITPVDSSLVSKSIKLNYIPYSTDVIKLAERPIPSFIVKSKLEFFNKIKKKNFVIFKIAPDDFKNGNDSLISEHILNNDRIYKIGLNRKDVKNAIISNLIGGYFNIWTANKEEYQASYTSDAKKRTISLEYLNKITHNIILHNTWLYLNYSKLDKIVWFDELPNLTIPDIGLYKFSDSIYEINTYTHEDRARRYFNDSDELLRVLDIFDEEMQPLIQNVINVSTDIANWKY